MHRPRHAVASAHEVLSFQEAAVLLGFAGAKQARRWFRKRARLLEVDPDARTLTRTSFELARALRTGDSGYHASARLEAYVKEIHDRPSTGRAERADDPGPT